MERWQGVCETKVSVKRKIKCREGLVGVERC